MAVDQFPWSDVKRVLPAARMDKFTGTGSQRTAGQMVDAFDFGALGDGTTDDTAAITSAMAQAVSSGLPCYLPAGTYVTTGLTRPTGLKALYGDGNDLTILKRKGGATSTASILTGTGDSDFTISDIGLDGNKANQSLGSNNLTLSACSDFQIRRVRSFSAKANAGYGSGIVLSLTPSTSTTGREAAVKDCEAYDNDADGLNIQRTGADLSVDGGDYSGNSGNGIYFYDQAITPAADTVPNMRIANLRAERNGSGGIVILGFYVSGIGGVRTIGHGSDPVYGLIVSACQVNRNTQYGIFVQATGAAIIGNTARNNGSTTHAGICANAESIVISGNTVRDNIYWGIDAGGTKYGTISGNQITGNSGVGINISANQYVTCADNVLVDNGYAQIVCARNDSGTKWFPWDAAGVDIKGNRIIETRSASNYGILTIGLPDDVRILDNTFVWPDTGGFNAIYGGLTTGVIRGNRLAGNTIDAYLMNTAATITYPEWVDALAFNSDTAPVTALQSRSAQLKNATIAAAKLTARGTGYLADFDVIITGGGGSGAAIRAHVTTDGQIAALEITNAGSGFSGTPTLDLSNGSGSGATAVAVVGAPNWNGKELKLLAHASAFRITDGAIIRLPCPAGGTVTVASGGTMYLRTVQSGWFPVSYQAPVGTIYPTTIQMPGGMTITSGSGTPEAAVTAVVGSLYLRSNGGASTTLYVKESGSGNTGWVAK